MVELSVLQGSGECSSGAGGAGRALAPLPPNCFPPPKKKADLPREESLQSPHFKSLVSPPPPNLEKCPAVPETVRV